jgi:D-glycero-D-manno-heptose 1,7-bisphosphate phosphatase
MSGVVSNFKRRAVFLDRDGTLNVDTGYVRNPNGVNLIEGAAEGVKRLSDAGFALVIVSNQSGIARGLMTLEQADAVDRQVLSLLRERGVAIAGTYRCPHFPQGRVEAYATECDCRKPKPGLLIRAAADLGLDLPGSWAIGDSHRDVEAAYNAGCKAILLTRSGLAKHSEGVYHAKNLPEAASIILSSP